MDDLDKYEWGKVFACYERGELSSAKKFIVEINKGIRFEGNVVVVLILKSMGYKVCKILCRQKATNRMQ
jgi:hypothetical protein